MAAFAGMTNKTQPFSRLDIIPSGGLLDASAANRNVMAANAAIHVFGPREQGVDGRPSPHMR